MSWEHVHLVHPRASASSLSKNRFQLRTFSIIWPNIPRQGQRYHEPSNTSSLKEQFISKAEAGLAALSFPSGDLLIERYWTCSPSFQFCFIIFHPCHALDPLTIFNHSCIEITSLVAWKAERLGQVLQRKGRAGRVRDGFGADPNPHQSTIANVTGF